MKIEGTGSLVTGGTSGIGKAIARSLLQRGGKVCVIGRDAEKGRRVEDELRREYGDQCIHYLQCDVTDADKLKSTFELTKELLGRLDIVVNNAGHVGEAKWEQTIAVDVTATCRGSLLALNMMRTDKGNAGGVVINVGAAVSSFMAMPPLPIYSAAKHAVVGLTRSLGARHTASTQVRFNCICPCAVDTALVNPENMKPEDWGEYYDDILGLVANVRKSNISRPEAVADVVMEMIEDDTCQGVAMAMSTKGKEVVNPPIVTCLDLDV